MVDARIGATPYNISPRNISRPADNATFDKSSVRPIADHASTRSSYNYFPLSMRPPREDCPSAIQPRGCFDVTYFASCVGPNQAAGWFTVLSKPTNLLGLHATGRRIRCVLGV
jgi:hypothetical protein